MNPKLLSVLFVVATLLALTITSTAQRPEIADDAVPPIRLSIGGIIVGDTTESQFIAIKDQQIERTGRNQRRFLDEKVIDEWGHQVPPAPGDKWGSVSGGGFASDPLSGFIFMFRDSVCVQIHARFPATKPEVLREHFNTRFVQVGQRHPAVEGGFEWKGLDSTAVLYPPRKDGISHLLIQHHSLGDQVRPPVGRAP